MSRRLTAEITRLQELLWAEMRTKETVQEWTGRAKGLVRALGSIGEEVPDKIKMVVFILGLKAVLVRAEAKLDEVDRDEWTSMDCR